MDARTSPYVKHLPRLVAFAFLFFLSIDMMGEGMKASFRDTLRVWLHDNAASFTELVSFVIGVLGASLVQSSSTVTAMAVVLASEGIVPLLIAVGIVHGANLGTSVTSSLVAFAAETHKLTGRPLQDLRTLLFERRLPGFHRAVSTAVVHGMFNAILVTAILLVLELPFGLIHRISDFTATAIDGRLAAGGALMSVLEVISPSYYTGPIVDGLLAVGLPGWALVLAGFGLLFACLKGFSTSMRALLLAGREDADPRELGAKLLGNHPADTFARGLLLTILVQSSSATTSMVVPLAAMGLFSVKRIFPFIMGANIGTTMTALLAAAAQVGTPGFHNGLTIALSHFYLNTLAVVLVVVVPGLTTSVLGCTEYLADRAEERPVALLGYLFALSLGMPLLVYFAPAQVAWVLLTATVLTMLVGPHFYLRRKRAAEAAAAAQAEAA